MTMPATTIALIDAGATLAAIGDPNSDALTFAGDLASVGRDLERAARGLEAAYERTEGELTPSDYGRAVRLAQQAIVSLAKAIGEMEIAIAALVRADPRQAELSPGWTVRDEQIEKWRTP